MNLIDIKDFQLSASLLRKAGWYSERRVSQQEIERVLAWWRSMGLESTEQAQRVISSLWGLKIEAVPGITSITRESIIFDMPRDRKGELYLPIDIDVIELLVEQGYAGPTTPVPVARFVSEWDVVCAVNADGRAFAVLAESELWSEWRSLDVLLHGVVTGTCDFTRKCGVLSWLPDEPERSETESS